LRGVTPGPKLTTRNTEPLGTAVPIVLREGSSLPSLSTEKPSVIQTTPYSAPGLMRGDVADRLVNDHLGAALFVVAGDDTAEC
jgi:hypothetical protein